MLPNAGLKPVYASGEDEPYDFFLSCLLNSESLDLGLGYFSSSAIRTLSIGFAYFIKNGGKLRIIFNNVLSSEDKEAISKGLTKDLANSVEQNLINDINSLSATLSKKDRHFFDCLTWLIANNRIEVIATVPKRNKNGIVHQKFGVFKDTFGNKVSFTGSANFSQNALLNNVEDLMCDFSWEESSHVRHRIEYFENIFIKTWLGLSTVSEIIDIQNVKVALLDTFPSKTEEELLEMERELIREESLTDVSSEFKSKLKDLESKIVPLTTSVRKIKELPVLREYQNEAIKKWEDNGYVGLLEMATGTGKTFTALGAINHLYKERKKLFVIISCPFIHLAEQWTDEARKFNMDSLLIGESKNTWLDNAARQMQLFKRGRIDFVLFVTTNASFKTEHFQALILPHMQDAMIVIDEAHYAGAESIRKVLPGECKYRLGLSATPQRHGDEDGSEALFRYFDRVVYSLPLKDAIGTFLTPYYYHPIPVELTEGEFVEYCQLTDQIIKLANKTDEASQGKLERLSIMRARVQNNSINKMAWLRENLGNYSLDYSLFYSGDEIFDETKRIIGREFKVSMHEFTSRQSRAERKKLLEQFSEQKIKSLVAMKCLDEGVDVPPTRVAFFIASSSSTREFVQRRGRVLRKSEGKTSATLYDLVSIPPMKFIDAGRQGPNYHSAKSAFRREYLRVQEFSSLAINQYSSLNELFQMADKLDLLDL